MTPPSTIAHYRITSKLGEGGMGAVYRATDTKLNRDVAIKVLPPAFAEDAARMQRFEREAQVLASLNHPNIAAIYGIEAGAIVMELVEGEDLKGPVPIETAIAYARQIATGVEAAHEKGIIHRDLKPANIKVTPDGVVKLLDFGLAKAAEEGSPAAAGATMSPTISLAMTQAGMILGTAAYMSPEQARGKPVDRRADIWAFGVVLFEMLSGRSPFGSGETVSDSMASVVKDEPEWSALSADTPPHLRRLLRQCLRKDPKVRLRDIGDARIALEDPDPSLGPADSSVATPRRAWLPWVLAGAALALVGATTGTAWFRTKPQAPIAVRFFLPWPEGTLEGGAPAGAEVVPSPDGRSIAFVAASKDGTSLWVRPMGSPEIRRLDKTTGASHPFWSPDSQFIGFFAENKLKKVAAGGGPVQVLCDVPPTTSNGDGGAWNTDGVIVFAPGRGKPLMRVLSGGSPVTPATSLDESAGDVSHSWPQFLPDGRHILYFAGNRDPANSATYVQQLGSPKRVRVMQNQVRTAWAPPGYLLFVRDRALFAQRIDSRTFQLSGEPVLVAESVRANENFGRAAFAVSGNGVLAYKGNRSEIGQLGWYSRDGKRLETVGKPGEYQSLRLSPDQKRVALSLGTVLRTDLWVMDLATGVYTRMTSDNQASLLLGPWSPDSQRMVVNLTASGGMLELSVASGVLRPLGKTLLYANDWSPDGRSLLCASRDGQEWASLPVEGDLKPQTIQKSSYGFNFQFSPDGKFVAYTSGPAGARQITVASFPSFAEKRQVSVDGGNYAIWRKDGRELFFQTLDGTVMSATINTSGRLEIGVPKPLFKAQHSPAGYRYASTGDGQRFLVIERSSVNLDEMTMIVVNWDAELKQP